MILSAKDIAIYIEEFKKVSYEDIINRNSYLSVDEIDNSIKELNSSISIDNQLIKQELHDLMQMLDSKYNLDSLYGFDTQDAQTFKNYIVQIKINALNEVKKTLQKNLPKNNHSSLSTVATNGVTIKDAIDEYLNSKSGVSQAVLNQDRLNLDRFTEWADIKELIYVDTLKHKDLINFRTYRQKLNPKSKPNTINRTLKE